ncbi:E3 ubiquitin-protein ligase RNF31-like [Eleutherodactylus coqui]|uniref:E3 ubiquitin-protein ligase RNF31-like n=1 Tax=Eleutherodactylus coqui TaxID=57060 RepID=UPI003463362C
MEFFNLLDTQIHHYLDSATHELFQCKLRDRALMEMPNFSWCSHCQFGVLHESKTLEMKCPTCYKSTCFKCKEQWDDVHKYMSCDQFKLWKMQCQDGKVWVYLAKNGIECPSCRFRFDLWKGGCLHFKCTQCLHDFCGGCRKPFNQGSECGFSENCCGRGLHAHHPRDCFFYLRDWDVERLQQLLQHNEIQYKSDFTKGPFEGFFESLRTTFQLDMETDEEDNANDKTEDKEYLVKIINANVLDPVDLYTEEEMTTELLRWNVPSPQKCGEESPQAYLKSLQMKIKQEIPLCVK